jgi:outer membrane immunogenic protein
MNFVTFGRGDVASLGLACLLVTTAPGAANAHEWFRIPNLMPASDSELGPISRTGLILSPDFEFSDELHLGGPGGSILQDTEGFSIGAKLGYDWQFGDIVLGAMTDGFYSFADGGGEGAGAGRYKSDLDYYGTVRGRLGYAIGRFMPYGTAGFAYGQLEVSDALTGRSDSELLTGWVYGGGLEYVWNDDITLHAGYRKIDFDGQAFSTLPLAQSRLSPQMDVIDLGLVRRY